MNYKINDTVLYGVGGVCRICEITEQKIGSDIEKYYILRPVCDERSTIFVPMSNEKLLNKMRPVHSNEEIASALERATKAEPEWIASDLERKEKFKSSVDNGDIYEVLCFLKSLYIRQEERISQGKKVHVGDERMMKDVEKILCDELSYVLKMKREAASAFIADKLGLKK